MGWYLPPANLFDLLLVTQGREKLGHCLTVRGYGLIGGELGQRSEEEASLSEPGMGDLKLRLVHLEIVEEQQVDVQRAGTETRRLCPAGRELESFCQSQDLPGIQSRVGQQGRVEIGGLGDGRDGAGAVYGRDVQDRKMDLQSFDRGSKGGLRVAEISAQGQCHPGRLILRSEWTPGREPAR